MSRKARIAIVLAVLAPAGALAQRPTADPRAGPAKPSQPRQPSDAPSVRPSTFGVYSEQMSRMLFAACDLNGDDTIVFREAVRTLKGMNRERFLAYDLNKDGRLQFAEFDKHYQRRTRFGGEVVITDLALQRLPERTTGPRGHDPVLWSWFSNLDKNGDDRLEFEEWKVLGQLLDKEPKARFVELDKDLSNSLRVTELTPMLPRISLLDRAMLEARANRRPLRPLPADYSVADLDRDGLLSDAELRKALNRIHPALVRYAPRLLASTDTNKDGHLDVFELRRAGVAKPPVGGDAREPQRNAPRR